MNGQYDTVILGAGAAGMMCAAHAAAKGGRVLVLDHASAPGEKIRISGGGRCNFTNLRAAPNCYLSQNRHFAKSALRRYTQHDFIALVERHKIPWHEKTLGQLFCDGSAREIVAMLLAEMERAGASLRLGAALAEISHADGRFSLAVDHGGARHRLTCRNFVLASGGLSIPKMGASGAAYDIARRFGLEIVETRPGLVPLTFTGALLEQMQALSGVALPVRASAGKVSFEEAALFTHRGLSGPAILQVSSYWRPGEEISVDLLPGFDAFAELRAARGQMGRKGLAAVLSEALPNRLAAQIGAEMAEGANLADLGDARLKAVAARLHDWRIKPAGSEGYRTAEVTCGGVDTAGLDSQSMQARALPGLYVIGEAVDVTGWLGGYNFQWAWSSGWAAGTAIAG